MSALVEARGAARYFTGDLTAGKRLALAERFSRLTVAEQPDPTDRTQRVPCYVVELYLDEPRTVIAECGTSLEDYAEAWRHALGWLFSGRKSLAADLEAVAGALM